jgi:hypothetical protein
MLHEMLVTFFPHLAGLGRACVSGRVSCYNKTGYPCSGLKREYGNKALQ